MIVTRHEIAILAWAVREARSWRGTLTGNPDHRALEEFDRNIATAEGAIKKLRAALPKRAEDREQP